MGADSLAENTKNDTENDPEFVCPSPKVLDFNENKALLGVRSLWLRESQTQVGNLGSSKTT